VFTFAIQGSTDPSLLDLISSFRDISLVAQDAELIAIAARLVRSLVGLTMYASRPVCP
jgi:hypothetical protein